MELTLLTDKVWVAVARVILEAQEVGESCRRDVDRLLLYLLLIVLVTLFSDLLNHARPFEFGHVADDIFFQLFLAQPALNIGTCRVFTQFHPGVLSNLLWCRSVFVVECHHVEHQILEFSRVLVLALRQISFTCRPQVLILAERKDQLERVEKEREEKEYRSEECTGAVFDCLKHVFTETRVIDDVIELVLNWSVCIVLSDCTPALPVVLLASPQNEFVKWISDWCLCQVRHRTSDHSEKDDAHREDVNPITSVASLL